MARPWRSQQRAFHIVVTLGCTAGSLERATGLKGGGQRAVVHIVQLPADGPRTGRPGEGDVARGRAARARNRSDP